MTGPRARVRAAIRGPHDYVVLNQKPYPYRQKEAQEFRDPVFREFQFHWMMGRRRKFQKVSLGIVFR